MSTGSLTIADGVTYVVGNPGTVTDISLNLSNGITGSVTDPTGAPILNLGLGAITPTSVAASGVVTGSNLSGVNTGDITISGLNYLSLTGQSLTANAIAESQVTNLVSDLASKLNVTDEAGGDLSGVFSDMIVTSLQLAPLGSIDAGAGHIMVGTGITINSVAMSGDGSLNAAGGLTLATVNSNVGSFGSSTAIPSFTVSGKGLITAASTSAVIAPAGTLTGTTLASNVITSSITTLGSDASLPGNPTTSTQTSTDNSTRLATTAYVTSAVNMAISGDVSKLACKYATTAALATNVYNNGTSGVGATLTGVSVGALSIDGNTPSAGESIVVKNEVDQTHNGIYIVTTVGSGIAVYVLTRRSDFNSSANITTGDTTFISSGSTLSATTWQMITAGTITPGSSNIVWTQIAGVGTYTAGTGLTLSGSQFSITNTAVSASSYGSSTAIPTFTVNAQGQLTAASTAAVVAPAGTVTGTTLASNVVTSSLTAIGTLSSGAVPFNLITSGSNTTAAMTVGVGASLSISTNSTCTLSFPGSIRVNGATAIGIDCLATSNSANIGATLTSNTSGHNGRIYAEVAGNNTGSDPFVHLFNSNVSNAFNWALGGDTSDSGALKFDAGTTIGSNTAFKMTTAGAASFLLGNLDVTRSASAATVSGTVSNSNNASGTANAALIASAGGSSGGDAYTQYVISGVTTWTEGADNSNSDSYVISASSTLGTTDVIRITTAGAVSFVLGDIDVARSSSGADVKGNVRNTSNTANSNAYSVISVGGSSAGDPAVTFDISGVVDHSLGVDNSDSDSLKIDMSTAAVGGNTAWKMTTAGERTLPLQPAFLAYLGTTATDVTGDSTGFVIGSGTALTEVFDQNADFNTNGTFTSPVTARYDLSYCVGFTGLAAGNAIAVFLTTSNATYIPTAIGGGARDSNNTLNTPGSVLADMDAADTAFLNVAVYNTAKVVDIVGSSNRSTYFSGFLAC